MDAPVAVLDDSDDHIPLRYRLPGLKEPLRKPGEGPDDENDAKGMYRGY